MSNKHVSTESNVNLFNAESIVTTSPFQAMNFLNEISEKHPNAISFVAGRPFDDFVKQEVEATSTYLKKYIDYRSRESKTTHARATAMVGQYSSASGIIGDLIAASLNKAEDTNVKASDCLITNGFQEALVIALRELLKPGECVLTLDPTYAGLAGATVVTGTALATVCDDPRANLNQTIEDALRKVEELGSRVAALYIIPDYANPTGRLLDVSERKRLLGLARDNDLIIIEDATYREFRYSGKRVPSLLALDDHEQVIHIGTFSKIFMPAARVGYAIVPGERKSTSSVDFQSLKTLKSYISVNTSTYMQGVVGGFLLSHDLDLEKCNQVKLSHYKRNLTALLEILDSELSQFEGISWSIPLGGFFLVLELPFRFSKSELEWVAAEYRVLVMPMTFFSLTGSFQNHIRLSFSNLDPTSIHDGIKRLAAFVKFRGNK